MRQTSCPTATKHNADCLSCQKSGKALKILLGVEPNVVMLIDATRLEPSLRSGGQVFSVLM